MEDVSFTAFGPLWLDHHPGEEEHVPVQCKQGAAGAHAAVRVGPWKRAAHFVGHQCGVCFHTLRQLFVLQVVKSERALENRPLLCGFPAGDNSWELSRHQDALSKVPLRQTGGNDVLLKEYTVAELDHRQVVIRTAFHVTRVDMN